MHECQWEYGLHHVLHSEYRLRAYRSATSTWPQILRQTTPGMTFSKRNGNDLQWPVAERYPAVSMDEVIVLVQRWGQVERNEYLAFPVNMVRQSRAQSPRRWALLPWPFRRWIRCRLGQCLDKGNSALWIYGCRQSLYIHLSFLLDLWRWQFPQGSNKSVGPPKWFWVITLHI